MKKNLFTLLLCAGAFTMSAQYTSNSPHSIVAKSQFDKVALSWSAPTDAIELKWHDGEDYNGDDGKKKPDGSMQVTTAAKFSADDIKQYAGSTVQEINYFEYRNVFEAYIRIYEDGKLAYEQKADLSNYKKNSWRKTTLQKPYTIPAGKEIMFAIKYVYGYNQELTAICDRSATVGKGNMISYDDGKTWKSTGSGDYLITAVVSNPSTGQPDGYNVYRDGAKVNTEAITNNSYTVSDNTDGSHSFVVSAIYGADEVKSYSVNATTTQISNMTAAVSSITATVEDGINGTISWTAPLSRSNEITWSNKQASASIGGTSATAPKVWIKQEFDANDLVAYPNHQITAINAYITEKAINSVTVFVIKNGVIDYSQPIADVSGITANAWAKFTLTTPYKFEAGNTYAFGCYYTHTAKAHPVGVDNSSAVENKGNSFSVSSPSSSDFNKTKPSWKTLTSGKIAGNFMLTADIEAVGEVSPAEATAAYDVYRNGELVAENTTANSFSDVVTDLGISQYSVVAKTASGKVSNPKNIFVVYSNPASIIPPQITASNFDADTKKVSLAWSNDVIDLKRYNKPTYIIGFNEDMPLLYGTKFTKEEMKPYVGYKFSKITFGIGDEIGEFKVEIYADKQAIFSYTIPQGGVTPMNLYTLSLDEDITIPADKDIYIVYNATLPSGKSPIILDGGPAVANGAMISYNNGFTWLKLGTISQDYNDYNIVIGATIIPNNAKAPRATATATKSVKLNSNGEITPLQPLGIESDIREMAPATAEPDTKPTVVGQRIYRNSELIEESTTGTFTETLADYGTYTYAVSNVYSNGWESDTTDPFSVNYGAPQVPEAPYALTGTASGNDLVLTWEDTQAEASLLKKHNGTVSITIGMTSTNPVGYHAAKFTAKELKDANKVGENITYVRFHLSSTDIKTSSVFVMHNGSIIYEQPVAVTSLNLGWNNIRLDQPVAIPEGTDVAFGYHITYDKGIKPCTLDSGPAISGYGDLISASASDGYWYSLLKKYKFNNNFMVEAICQKESVSVTPTESANLDLASESYYNVYCNGALKQSNIAEKTYTVKDAETGSYTVTYVDKGVESSESNSVLYQSSGLNDVNVDNAILYDAASQTVTLNKATDVTVYSAAGIAMITTTEATSVSLKSLDAGVYIVKAGNKALKVIK